MITFGWFHHLPTILYGQNDTFVLSQDWVLIEKQNASCHCLGLHYGLAARKVKKINDIYGMDLPIS